MYKRLEFFRAVACNQIRTPHELNYAWNPFFRRPREAEKREYTKSGRLIPTAKRGKEIKQP